MEENPSSDDFSKSLHKLRKQNASLRLDKSILKKSLERLTQRIDELEFHIDKEKEDKA